ncbi:MAG: M6 family metalloprotease domain-containing protein, partial [Duncaniella sp.]|nr:M6 family metalloprotease domain-containing protein [Duncaniella sp.]
YGGNNYSGDDQRPAHMVVEACELLDGQIDFSQYDRDGDGEVDNVFVFYAGRGEASGGPAESVWPHAWNVEYGVGYSPQFDGVTISRYACSNEYESGRPDGVGTFVHEFSHVMGLPDLYATSYTSSFTPGSWSCMDYGPYNNNGCTPPLYGAFERYALGWMEPMEITKPINATLESIGSNKAGIIKTSKSNEFFLLENRQQVSWDKYIPGHGMLVWHIDYNESVWNSNKVNNTPSHQYVDIEEADGSQSEGSRAGDAFPGTSNVTSFTDNGNPNMKTWSGQALNKPITDIAERAGIITFKAMGGRTEELVGTTALEPLDSDDESFTAAWEAVPEAEYLLSVYVRDDNNEVQYIPGYDHKRVGSVTSWKVSGLDAGNTYYYTVATSTGWEQSDESNEITVTTGDLPLNKMTAEALEAADITENGFTARWNLIPLANDYILSVYTKEATGSYHEINDFVNGPSLMPEGWGTNTTGSYAMAAYSGNAVPSLRLGKSSDMVCSPICEDGIKTITFWHRGNGSGSSDILEVAVFLLSENGWKIVAEIPVVKDAGGVTTTIEVPYEDAVQASITLRRNSGMGAVAVDDIDVAHGVALEDTPVEGLTELHVGDVAEHVVGGLLPGTEYYYKVRATDGTLVSRLSDEISVKTDGKTPESGLAEIATPAVSLTVSGLTVSSEAELMVYDLAGRLMGRGTSVTLPARGVYIVSAEGVARKIVL